MTRETYRASLADLRGDVVEMGELVASRLADALASLREGDPDLAEAVVAGDDDVDERYLALEGDCVDLFALQQPVASDLRFIAASFKIITDLERVGDLAVNLAEYGLATDRGLAPEVAVQDIGREVGDLLDRSLAAYERGDAEACRAIADGDDQVDALCQRASERVVRDLVEREATGEDPFAVERLLDDVTRVLLTIRDLERVGDHAVNVAARTLYMTESDPALL